jgi:uncharacterized protein YecE (DUF72 family)
MPELCIGCSGFSYPHWRGRFYPDNLPPKGEFIADLPLTAGFVYLRRHGRGGSYAGCYSQAELLADAGRIRSYLEGGRDVYIYFNNDAQAFAPQNARELAQLLDLPVTVS